jgi:hypothetical protein
VPSPKREAAIAAAERTCPRCSSAREPDQSYCVNCGLRLPPLGGRLASMRRGWLRRFGWYPGDWIWVSLPTLVVAIAGGATAIALSNDGGGAAGTTFVASTTKLTTNAAPPVAKAAGPLPTAPEPGGASTTGAPPTAPASTSAQPNGRLTWPVATNGWTIVLVSYPLTRGRRAPLETARRAAGLGLPEVGVLHSSDFSSLHPGYAIVFSGVYRSRADAEAALTSARATGFGTAYTREISR